MVAVGTGCLVINHYVCAFYLDLENVSIFNIKCKNIFVVDFVHKSNRPFLQIM